MKLSDLGNSFNKIFEERISSPLYGTFIISWLIWNWKIIYLTIFINKDDIQPSNKIQYILDNYINWWVLLWFPLISTVVLITVIPLVANKLYKVHLYYERERTRDKEKSDAGNRLTIRQSADIRNEMMMLVENNQKQIDTKTNELKIARQQIDTWRIERMEYKVLVALYGKNGVYSDVTRIVQDYVTSERSFLVENEVLGGDPLWAVHKELFIIYQFENSIKSIFAREHYQINTTSNYGMEANDTKKSIGIYKDEKQVQNREILSNLFSGTWHLAYDGVESGSEDVQIKEGYQYFAKGESETEFTHVFNLENISFDNDEIRFTKVGAADTDKRMTNSVLTAVKKGVRYQGTEENGTIRVYYQKLLER